MRARASSTISGARGSIFQEHLAQLRNIVLGKADLVEQVVLQRARMADALATAVESPAGPGAGMPAYPATA